MNYENIKNFVGEKVEQLKKSNVASAIGCSTLIQIAYAGLHTSTETSFVNNLLNAGTLDQMLVTAIGIYGIRLYDKVHAEKIGYIQRIKDYRSNNSLEKAITE